MDLIKLMSSRDKSEIFWMPSPGNCFTIICDYLKMVSILLDDRDLRKSNDNTHAKAAQ